MLYFCGMPGAHQICQPSVVAANRSAAFAMRWNANTISHQNEIRDELSNLASATAFYPLQSATNQEFTPASCAAEPKLTPEKQESPVNCLFQKNSMEDHGDILVGGLWA
jgi:hypothetical protein